MVNVGLKTYNLKKEEIERKWYLIDAKDKNLGRLCTEVAKILRGKNKPSFTPHLDCGDYVVIINADKIKVTGNKLKDKKYYRHSGYVGNLKVTNLEKMLEKSPEFVIRNAVKGMLPRNTLGRKMLKKLKIYRGEENKHSAQKPQKIDL
ncbi:MAG: 50S ribosomal protein L13 [Actinomycetota bacterium]|jgi:large subunit ribosomal protein L13|nr:50S ribosomal protein L13 [Actinomycetota bacterium]MDD5600918.1 50S ribosomal protein L13 [Actinomycetota bacterium]